MSGPPLREERGQGPVDLVLRGVRVLDASGSFDGPVDLATRDGVVTALARHVARGRDALEVDAAGLWLMPGVVDCHAHIGYPSLDTDEVRTMSAKHRAAEAAGALRRTLHAGVTLLRDAGGVDAALRDDLADGRIEGPRLQVAIAAPGPAGDQGEGYLSWPAAGPDAQAAASGRPDGGRGVTGTPVPPRRLPLRTSGPEDMRAAVRALVSAGADWIKLLATGGVFSAGDEDFPQTIGEPEIAAAVAEAGRWGRGVMVHAHGGPAVRAAVTAGARSIEHGVYLTEEDARLLATKGCFFVPTLTVYHQLVALADAGGLGTAAAERARAVGRRLGEAVAIARAAGVRIALGSDAGDRRHHGGNLAELCHLHRAGLTVEEALLAGTAAGADLCGAGDRAGRLAPGRDFDAVVLDEDPGDLSCFLRPGAVTGVFLRGAPVLRHRRLDRSG